MPTYLVESYLANSPEALADARARVRRAAEFDDGVRYVRTTFLPEDEVVLHVFEASSEEALRRAAARVALAHERISPVVEEAVRKEARR